MMNKSARNGGTTMLLAACGVSEGSAATAIGQGVAAAVPDVLPKSASPRMPARMT
jgi:hypothetical protein